MPWIVRSRPLCNRSSLREAVTPQASIHETMKTYLLTAFLGPGLALNLFVSPAAAQSSIFIVRHAEKAESTGNDQDLSEAGRARAEALAYILKDAKITGIYTTEFKRTQQTAAPLARALGLETIVHPAQATEFATKLRSAAGNALVVGHSNTIPELIKELGIDTPIKLTDHDYDNLFVVVLEQNPRLIRLHYR